MQIAPGSTAVQLMAELTARRLSSVDLLEHYIDRYYRYNATVNAIVVQDFERARLRAKEADSARERGETWGPLHGLPMTVKESFEVAGLPCTSGFPGFSAYRSAANADVVDSLFAAGAIIFGKTNSPLFNRDVQTYNEVYGQTNNPWDLATVPGGSSGGAAAALAACLTPVEVGTDLGGSIRTPSHCCGVYGHKPSFGLVSMKGNLPMVRGAQGDYGYEGDLAVIGPMARSAADLGLMLDVIAKPRAAERRAYTLTLPAPRKTRLEDFRVGVWLDDPFCSIDSAVERTLASFISRLESHGVRIEHARPDIDFAESHAIYTRLLHADASPYMPDEMHAALSGRLGGLAESDTSFETQLVRGATLSHRDWLKVNAGRHRLRERWAEYFTKYDVLLCPVIPITAFDHDHSELLKRKLVVNGCQRGYFDTLLSWVGLATVSYLPATTMPIGLAENGMPVGIQAIGAYLNDKTTIEFARLVQEILGDCPLPAGYQG